LSVITLRNFFSLIIFVLFASLWVKIGHANERIDVVTENWYPYNYLDDRGNIVGKSTTIVKIVLDDAGVDYSIELLPWTRALDLASTRPNVLIYSILRTPARETLFQWICPISDREVHQLYKLADRADIVVRTEQDIKNYSVSVTRETFLHQYMLELGLVEGENLQVTSDDSISALLFLAGRVDLLAEFESSLIRTLQKEGLNEDIVTPLFSLSPRTNPDNCMAFSMQTPTDVVEKVRRSHQKFIVQPKF
jgi:polar amino acid transport system substrate-binding protein